MTLVNATTGEIVEYDPAAAERRAERITLRLDAIADNYRAVLPMIREAIEKRDDIALGYRSPGDYVSDRFGQALAGLGIEVRRAVVGELTEAGMSTRAIAPVVGVSNKTVHQDIQAGVTEVTPESFESADLAADDVEEAEILADTYGDVAEEDFETALAAARDEGDLSHENVVTHLPTSKPMATVTGIDGKKYATPPRRTPRPAAERTLASIQSQAARAARDAQILTPEQIRRVKAEAGHVVSSLRNSIEVLQHLANSLDNKESK